MRDPIIIVSPGMCGSSSLARILQDEFHVYMGDPKRFASATYERKGPPLLYEDIEITSLVHDSPLTSFKYRILIEDRQNMGIPWGFKVGGWDVERIHRWLLAPFKSPTIIRLERDMATGTHKADALNGHQARIRCLLGDRPVLPMYLSDIVYGTASLKLIEYQLLK